MQQTVNSTTLIKASICASLIAAIILLTIILPAEYNIDPTGIGKQLGVTQIAKASLPSPAITANSSKVNSNEFQVIETSVAANSGVEYKFEMQQYDKISYEWITDGSSVYSDLHGEPKGDTTGYFESYAIAVLNEMKGSFTAPFSGKHGWYWKNSTDKPIAIQLLVKGQYREIGIIK